MRDDQGVAALQQHHACGFGHCAFAQRLPIEIEPADDVLVVVAQQQPSVPGRHIHVYKSVVSCRDGLEGRLSLAGGRIQAVRSLASGFDQKNLPTIGAQALRAAERDEMSRGPQELLVVGLLHHHGRPFVASRGEVDATFVGGHGSHRIVVARPDLPWRLRVGAQRHQVLRLQTGRP